ncbi:MAG: hypothetical protein II886_01065 [Prevotella sp.]|nr:hypothetical protein [Prevotella sp.]
MKKAVYLYVTLCLLAILVGCTTEGERAAMRAGLDSINVRNRTDRPFTVRDVEPYVRFFDDHGTPNDRLLAHYLLGRAYYEHGEAPMALQCYHDAIYCADTTAADCDYKQLCRVYAQMAQVFYEQGMYREQLVFQHLSSEYGWKGKDTLAALMSYEQESFAYKELGLTDSAIFVIEDVASKYEQYGYPSDAAISLGTIIRTLVNKGEYQKAKNYMELYESNSGRFDSQGNIIHGREVYYSIKGTYYLKTNKLDSAEYYFRKELHDGRDFNNQNGAAIGLAKLYELHHALDSASKYFQYAYEMNDSMFAHTTTQTIERMQAMYDYSRHQEIARQEKEKASEERNKRLLTAALLVLMVLLTTGVLTALYFKRRKEQRLYATNLDSLEKAQSEVLQLREYANAFEELIDEKEKVIKHLTAKLTEKNRNARQNHTITMEQIHQSAVYQDIKVREKTCKALTKEQLRKIRLLVIEKLPDFNGKLLEKQYRLNDTDFNVCLLLRLGIKSKEISVLLKISQPRVSQICTKVLATVFNKPNGGVNDLIELLCNYY